MGGGGMPEEGGHGKKKKKSLDAVINVVPAIDLLSCCISFLLFTAVWTQISRLQVQQRHGCSIAEVHPEERRRDGILAHFDPAGLIVDLSTRRVVKQDVRRSINDAWAKVVGVGPQQVACGLQADS